MYPWQIIWRDIQRFFHRRRLLVVNEETARSLDKLTEIKQSSTDEVLWELLETAIRGNEMDTYAVERWQKLSGQEKRVTALICAGLTTDQIAAQLGIAPTTVKSHIKNIFVKYQVHDRQMLREMLSSYDLKPFE